MLDRPTDNKGGSGLIDQNTVYFVNDGEIEIPLDKISQVEFHVVSQIIETEFIVGAIGDITAVGIFTLGVIHSMGDRPDGKP